MSTSDGYILGKTKIVDHGSASSKWNLVIMGDGYQLSEINKYHDDVKKFVDKLYATKPFDQVWCGINIYRIDAVSTDSGADDPGTCGDHSTGTGATRSTYFDSTFCGDGNVRRLLTCNNSLALSTSTTQVPEAHVSAVIVNDSRYGGSGGSVLTFSTDPQSAEIGVHELGHTAFGFADEYEYRQGCASGETGHDNYTGGEPTQPNITINTNRATIKWSGLISPTTAMPTTSNPNCSQCDTQASPVPASTVGAFEGAGYFHCGCFRPEFICRMRALGNPFCEVCQQVIINTLTPFLAPESITLSTPSVTFSNIPEGLGGTGVTTYRAVSFEVISCRNLTFRITAGPTGGFGTPLGTVVLVPPSKIIPIASARLWISYTSTTAGSISMGTVTVQCDETGQNWVIPINANTVARPKSAVAFVFDHSGSMSEDAGDGATKVQKLREAANIFVNVMLQGDGIGIVRFNETADILMPVTDVGVPSTGAGRVTAIGIINSNQLDPGGNTSIGDGVVKGKQNLDSVSSFYDVNAMLVLTDGMENTAPTLSSVGSSITANTFAVGLGLPSNISTSALTTLCAGHNGYLLITGLMSSDQSTLLTKYFLQILAGITNANVVLDPISVLTPGAVHRIPFSISEADMGIDVLLISPAPQFIKFAVETPEGDIIYQPSAAVFPNITYVPANGVHYYRISLPAIAGKESGTHGGTWYVLLEIDAKYNYVSEISRNYGNFQIPYNIVVHSYSNLNFDAFTTQKSFEVGSEVTINTILKEYDVPVDNRASCWAEITKPDNTIISILLKEINPGSFQGKFNTSLYGLYSIRVRAIGKTFYDTTFTREKTLTAYAFTETDNNNGPDINVVIDWLQERDEKLCYLLECLTSNNVISEKFIQHLHDNGFNLVKFRECLNKICYKVK